MVSISQKNSKEFSLNAGLDSSKFGEKYLQSLGWTSGQGLGLTGDGRKDNIKVVMISVWKERKAADLLILQIHQKLDLLGIGANQRGPEADDWRAGREYDRLLSRLNQTQCTPQEPEESPSLAGFQKPSISEPSPDEPSQTNKKKRKRSSDEEVEEKPVRESRKKEKEEKKKNKKETKKAKKGAIRDSSPATPNDVLQADEKISTAPGPLYRA